jgi:hypothetical protein
MSPGSAIRGNSREPCRGIHPGPLGLALLKTEICDRFCALGTPDDVSGSMDPDLVSRDELTATLFAIQDIREDVQGIRELLEDEEDGEARER